ncbi:(Fe-S)-binding protein [Zhaonella formicivorans]|uniref:(Fe-S)-binding protein n=1 Tax=Zhaonella formicivorans TaxID=2528593 RepID=UPI0010E167FD|nr:(Fe-S)-binding protein [Zhaonella formicivorans]
MFHQLPVVRDQLKKCVRCGQCRAVCPIFKEIGTETAAPRGHVFLVQKLRDKELIPSSKVADRANRCLLCESCSSECPSGIKVHEMVAAARDYLADYQSKPLKRFLLRSIWAHPERLNLFLRLAYGYQKFGLQSLAQKTGLVKLLAGELAQSEALLGNLPPKSALSFLGHHIPAQGTKKLKVGYFLGCATNHFSPEVALAAVKVLTRNGCEVIIPEGLKCCGLPNYANGDMDLAKTLARENIEAFSQAQVDFIITDCASCSSVLKGPLYKEWQDADMIEKAQAFQAKVLDLNIFLLEKITLNGSFAVLAPTIITYHDPCHLAKAQKVYAQPRQLLSMIPGVEIREMNNPDQCCGGAGTFSFFNYDLSMKILDRKMKSIKETGAQIIATSCPACTMQLRHGLKRHQLKGKVMHPVELLAQAYENRS